jgi:hypothetical protein
MYDRCMMKNDDRPIPNTVFLDASISPRGAMLSALFPVYL